MERSHHHEEVSLFYTFIFSKFGAFQSHLGTYLSNKYLPYRTVSYRTVPNHLGLGKWGRNDESLVLFAPPSPARFPKGKPIGPPSSSSSLLLLLLLLCAHYCV